MMGCFLCTDKLEVVMEDGKDHDQSDVCSTNSKDTDFGFVVPMHI